jgi:hypothetical protein
LFHLYANKKHPFISIQHAVCKTCSFPLPRPGAAEVIFMGRTLVMTSASWHTGNVYIYIYTPSNYEKTYEVGIAHLTHT